jgi:hypothetical protein
MASSSNPYLAQTESARGWAEDYSSADHVRMQQQMRQALNPVAESCKRKLASFAGNTVLEADGLRSPAKMWKKCDSTSLQSEIDPRERLRMQPSTSDSSIHSHYSHRSSVRSDAIYTNHVKCSSPSSSLFSSSSSQNPPQLFFTDMSSSSESDVGVPLSPKRIVECPEDEMEMDTIAEGMNANHVLVEDVTPSDCTDLVKYEPFSCVSEAKRMEMLDRYGPAGAHNVLTMLTPSPAASLPIKGPWSASEMYPESEEDEYAEIMYATDMQRRALGYVPPQNSPDEERQAPFIFDASPEPRGGDMDVDDDY